jgi:hypothetical protein
MQNCKGCRQQQTNDALCLVCIEDLSAWLRQIPDLYHELGSVRLPGSVRHEGPRARSSSTGSAAPVRLAVVDLLDRGETLRRLWDWTDQRLLDVQAICDGFRHHLLSIVTEDWAGDFWRAMRALCRDLGRTVGEPEERPVGKCSKPVEDSDELCRGQLFRTADGAAVYCRRCGDKPELLEAQVWVSLEQAARLVGRPLETVRTWYKRGKLGWSADWTWELPPPLATTYGRWSQTIGPQPFRMAWLPAAVRLANAGVTTLPRSSGIVNHGSGAELSPAVLPGAGVFGHLPGGGGNDDSDDGQRSGGTGGWAPAPMNREAPIPQTSVPAECTTPTGSDPVAHLTAGSDSSAVTTDVAGAEQYASQREQSAKSTDRARS